MCKPLVSVCKETLQGSVKLLGDTAPETETHREMESKETLRYSGERFPFKSLVGYREIK